MILLFLSSGLFLGWSLGANDAANVFGSAVGSRMVKFRTAAIVCSFFLIIGAVVGGSGTSATLGRLGSVNVIGGAFIVALSAALSVFMMTKSALPVSTSQAIVGAIIGWNLFASFKTDYSELVKITISWVASPVLAALIAALLYKIARYHAHRSKIHLLRQDSYTRIGLILVGAFGSYSLGANNIANVMGVFVPVSPIGGLNIGPLSIAGTQILFLIGGISIAVGVFTYSGKVMKTIGDSLLKLSPRAALVVVLANAIVLFLFSSVPLKNFLLSIGLPAIPLVPVSSSQAIVGAVIGIGLVRNASEIRFSVLKSILIGWIATPVIAGVVCYVLLFVAQNVFEFTVKM